MGKGRVVLILCILSCRIQSQVNPRIFLLWTHKDNCNLFLFVCLFVCLVVVRWTVLWTRGPVGETAAQSARWMVTRPAHGQLGPKTVAEEPRAHPSARPKLAAVVAVSVIASCLTGVLGASVTQPRGIVTPTVGQGQGHGWSRGNPLVAGIRVRQPVIVTSVPLCQSRVRWA